MEYSDDDSGDVVFTKKKRDTVKGGTLDKLIDVLTYDGFQGIYTHSIACND
jgi:hypothetical protein